MNNNVKILLTVEGIKGGTIRRVGTYKIPFVLKKRELDYYNYGINYKGKDGDKIVRRGYRRIPKYEISECTKSIKLTQDAYDYMISRETPSWYLKKDWSRLTPTTRLEMHLDRICKHNEGTSFVYTILEE